MLETCSLEDTTHVSKYHWYRVRLWTFPSNWISRRLNASLWSVQKIHIKTLNVKIDRLLLIRYQLKSLERNEEYQLIYLPIKKAKRLEIFLTTIRRITITVVEVNPSKVRVSATTYSTTPAFKLSNINLASVQLRKNHAPIATNCLELAKVKIIRATRSNALFRPIRSAYRKVFI